MRHNAVLAINVAAASFNERSYVIRNGEIVDYGDMWYKESLAPRTVIGQKGPLEYVILEVKLQ